MAELMKDTFILMNKNIPILKCRLNGRGTILGVDEIYHADALPVCISGNQYWVDEGSLYDWWISRSIPASRIGLRETLERLNVGTSYELIQKCYGLSLSDQYWMNPEGRLKWSEVNFFENDFSEDMGKVLCGEKVVGEIDFMSPDNTSDGWLQKKWKIIDGERYLFKGGSLPYLQEPVNEVIATKLMDRIPDCKHVSYDLVYQNEKPYSICANFVTVDTEFVPALHVFRSMPKDMDTGSYQHLLQVCDRLEIKGIQPFLDKMLVVDYILSNSDRHFGNFGFIRNVETLQFEGMAPVFDSGSCLYYNCQDQEISSEKEAVAKPFASNHVKQLSYVHSFDNLEMAKMYDFPEQVREIFREYKSPLSEERISRICRCISDKINSLERYIAKAKQGTFQNVKSMEEMFQNVASYTTKKLETELLKNGYVPTETMISNLKVINEYLKAEVSLTYLRDMYKALAQVPEEIRDSVYQVGEELKKQEIERVMSEKRFLEP